MIVTGADGLCGANVCLLNPNYDERRGPSGQRILPSAGAIMPLSDGSVSGPSDRSDLPAIYVSLAFDKVGCSSVQLQFFSVNVCHRDSNTKLFIVSITTICCNL